MNIKAYPILIFLFFLLNPLHAMAENEYLTAEMLTSVQENEVTLNDTPSEFQDGNEILVTEEVEENNETTKTNEGLGAADHSEFDFEIIKEFQKTETSTKKEDSLFGKILHSEIVRTDVPLYLFQDDLTFKYEKGPIDKIQYYGAYRGDISNLWTPQHTTKYDNLVTQFGMYGALKKKDYAFKLKVSPIPQKNLNYADSFISDAYLINTSIPNHQIIAGYSRVLTGVEGGKSTFILPFVARSQIAQHFGSAKSLSVKILGNYQYIDYNLAVGSAGRYISRGMPGAEVNGWVNVKPFGNKNKKYGKLVIGGGYNGGHNRIDYSVLSGYVGYNHKKLWTNFETAIADGYNGLLGPSENKASGYAATLGWKFTPHWQLIGRIDQFDPNRHQSRDHQREYTIGVNWFIKGQALKVVLNYVFCDNQTRKDSHKLILATQILI